MKFRYTQGPWKLASDPHYGLCVRTTLAAYGPIPIAIVKNCDVDESKGNGQILAASVELFQAVEAILNSCIGKKVVDQAHFEKAIHIANKAYGFATTGERI